MRYFIINWDFDTSDAGYERKSKRASAFCEANLGIRVSQSTWLVFTNHGLDEVAQNFVQHVRGSDPHLLAPMRDSSDRNELKGGDHVNIGELGRTSHTDQSVFTWMAERDPLAALAASSQGPAPSG